MASSRGAMSANVAVTLLLNPPYTFSPDNCTKSSLDNKDVFRQTDHKSIQAGTHKPYYCLVPALVEDPASIRSGRANANDTQWCYKSISASTRVCASLRCEGGLP